MRPQLECIFRTNVTTRVAATGKFQILHEGEQKFLKENKLMKEKNLNCTWLISYIFYKCFAIFEGSNRAWTPMPRVKLFLFLRYYDTVVGHTILNVC
jgi:hypothetical protein